MACSRCQRDKKGGEHRVRVNMDKQIYGSLDDDLQRRLSPKHEKIRQKNVMDKRIMSKQHMKYLQKLKEGKEHKDNESSSDSESDDDKQNEPKTHLGIFWLLF